MRIRRLSWLVAASVAALALTGQAGQEPGEVDWPARFEAKLAELREQGEPVTAEDVMARRPQVPDDQNCALVFLRAFVAQERAAADPPPVEGLEQGFAAELGVRQSEEVLHAVGTSVEANAEALALIREGMRLPEGVYPVTLDPCPMATLMPHLGPLRAAARLCLREAAVHAHAGDAAAAADALLAVRHLAASLGGCPFLIEASVRAALDGMLLDGAEKTLGLCEMPPSALEGLARAVTAEDGELLLVEAMRSARASDHYFFTAPVPDVVRYMKMAGMSLVLWIPDPKLRARDGVQFCTFMDEVIRAAALPEREKLAEATRLRDEALEIPDDFFFARLITPAIIPSLSQDVRSHTSLKVGRAALAVELWRLQNGGWPESLSDLVPEWLDEVPQDPYADGTIRYARTERGIVVYSVGPDRQDDGGRPCATELWHGDYEVGDLAFALLDPAARGARNLTIDDWKSPWGLTLLHVAAGMGEKELAERLLAEGADVNAPDEEGRTPLHTAAAAGKQGIADLLLQHGADVNAMDNEGQTPTRLATQWEHDGLVEFLREHGGIE